MLGPFRVLHGCWGLGGNGMDRHGWTILDGPSGAIPGGLEALKCRCFSHLPGDAKWRLDGLMRPREPPGVLPLRTPPLIARDGLQCDVAAFLESSRPFCDHPQIILISSSRHIHLLSHLLFSATNLSIITFPQFFQNSSRIRSCNLDWSI